MFVNWIVVGLFFLKISLWVYFRGCVIFERDVRSFVFLVCFVIVRGIICFEEIYCINIVGNLISLKGLNYRIK